MTTFVKENDPDLLGKFEQVYESRLKNIAVDIKAILRVLGIS